MEATVEKSRRRREFRALPAAPLHRAVKAAAKAAHMSIGGWLLQAAEEKLARDAKHKDGEAA